MDLVGYPIGTVSTGATLLIKSKGQRGLVQLGSTCLSCTAFAWRGQHHDADKRPIIWCALLLWLAVQTQCSACQVVEMAVGRLREVDHGCPNRPGEYQLYDEKRHAEVQPDQQTGCLIR